MTAVLLPNGKQSYATSTGAPLVGGKIFTYDSGTLNPRTTWQDAGQIATNANPVILDARGEATIFWSGAYRVIVQDSLGNIVIPAIDGISDQNYQDVQLRTDLATTGNTAKGAAMVGFDATVAYGGTSVGAFLYGIYKRTNAETLAGVTPVNFGYAESALYRYGTNTTPGTTDMTSALASAALVAAFSGRIILPLETIKTTAATALPSNCTVSGGGYLTNLLATTANQVAIFTTASGKSNIRIENARFTGSDTASATANGTAIFVTDSDHVRIDRCYFTLFGSPPILIVADDTVHNDFVVSNCYFFGNKIRSAAPGENGEITTIGATSGVRITGCRFEASATTTYARGIFIQNNGASFNWTDIEIDSCYFKGYVKNAIGTTDENPSGTFDTGIIKVTNCTVLSTIQSGIKIKNSWRVICTQNYLQDCDSSAEVPGTLQGTIFINCSQDTVCSDNIIINAGTDGIRIQGGAAGSGGTTAGAQRVAMNCNNNIIESAQQSGIFTTNDLYESNLLGNSIRNSVGSGIRIQPGVGNPGLSMVVANNNIRGTSASASGLIADSVTGLILTGNNVKLCSGYGMQLSNLVDVVINGNMVMDNGIGNVNTSGIKLSTVTNVIVSNNRAGNNVATDQDYGLELGASVTGLVYDTNNNFTGNQIAPDLGLSLPTVASAAALTLTSKTTLISGTTNITSIVAAGWVGQTITLIFQGALTFTDGSNLKLAGNFVTTADDSITLTCDGTSWFEVCRSVN